MSLGYFNRQEPYSSNLATTHIDFLIYANIVLIVYQNVHWSVKKYFLLKLSPKLSIVNFRVDANVVTKVIFAAALQFIKGHILRDKKWLGAV